MPLCDGRALLGGGRGGGRGGVKNAKAGWRIEAMNGVREGVKNVMAGWGIGQGEGEEIDEGEAATTTTAMMTAQFFLFPLEQTFVDQARATLPLTLRCHGRRCCGGAMLGRWGFPPLLRRGCPCATIQLSCQKGLSG